MSIKEKAGKVFRWLGVALSAAAPFIVSPKAKAGAVVASAVINAVSEDNKEKAGKPDEG